MFVSLSVWSLLRYRLNAFLPPLLKVGCPTILKIPNPWKEVVLGKKWSHIRKLLLTKSVKSPRKTSLFLDEFCKDQEAIQQRSGGYTTRIKRLYNKDHKVIQ